jgi:hypothetical protein
MLSLSKHEGKHWCCTFGAQTRVVMDGRLKAAHDE